MTDTSKNGAAGTALRFTPTSVDSLDARILQYKYALIKLEKVLGALDGMLRKCSAQQDSPVVLVQYLTFLISGLFAINESGFAPKVAALELFKVPKAAPVTISQVVTHVPYDVRDAKITPLEDLPLARDALQCLKALRAMCLNCQEGYQKRLTNASRELNNDDYLADLDELFHKAFFRIDDDFDLNLQSKVIGDSALLFEINPSLIAETDYSEASLIDMDLGALFTIITEMAQLLEHQKLAIANYKILKQAPKQLQESQFQSIPNSSYALHKVLFWAMRINDLYTILRKYVRQIYTSNFQHLHDQKFQSFVRNATQFRSLLSDIDDAFFSTKKNGVLIATITRYIRMNAKHDVNLKSVLDFVGFIVQSITHMELLITKLKEFSYEWIAGEILFRRTHDLPMTELLKLNDTAQAELVKEIKIRRSKIQLPDPKKSTAQKPSPQKPTVQLKAPAKQEPKVTPEAAQVSEVKTQEPSRPRSESIGKQSTLFAHKNSSAASLQSLTSPSKLEEKSKAITSTPQGRRRSSSQPLSFNAAAAALKGNAPTTESKLRSPTGSIRSPTGSIRRNSISGRPPPLSFSSPTRSANAASSPAATKTASLNTVDEKSESSTVEVKRTASQKFRQHLMEASKSGMLYQKEKEVMSNVVFDPNNPSALNLRRQAKPQQAPKPAEVAIEETPQATVPPAAEIPKSDQKVTRAQITKMNTQRNSTSVFADSSEALSNSSRNSVLSELSQSSNANESILVKKVRFTGVPEYTPAEDAPMSQSSRILRNFAALKIPSVKHTSFKQKDSLLKKEESLLFKQLQHSGTSVTPNLTGSYNPASSVAMKLSKFRNKI